MSTAIDTIFDLIKQLEESQKPSQAAEVREHALQMLIGADLIGDAKYSEFVTENVARQRRASDLGMLQRTVAVLEPHVNETNSWYGEFVLAQTLTLLHENKWSEANRFSLRSRAKPTLFVPDQLEPEYMALIASFIFSTWIKTGVNLPDVARDLARDALEYSTIHEHVPTKGKPGALALLAMQVDPQLLATLDASEKITNKASAALFAGTGEYFADLFGLQWRRNEIFLEFREKGSNETAGLVDYRDLAHKVLGSPTYPQNVKRDLALTFYCDMLLLCQNDGSNRTARTLLSSSVVARFVNPQERISLLSATENVVMAADSLSKLPQDKTDSWSVIAVQLLGSLAHHSLDHTQADTTLVDVTTLRRNLSQCGVNHPILPLLSFYEACAELFKNRGRFSSSFLISMSLASNTTKVIAPQLISAHSWLRDYLPDNQALDSIVQWLSNDVSTWPRFLTSSLRLRNLASEPKMDATPSEMVLQVKAVHDTAMKDLGPHNALTIAVQMALIQVQCSDEKSISKSLADDILNLCNNLMTQAHLYLPRVTRMRELQIDVLEQLGDFNWAARICSYVRSLKSHSRGPRVTVAQAELVEREVKNLILSGQYAAVLQLWTSTQNLMKDTKPQAQSLIWVANAAEREGNFALAERHYLSAIAALQQKSSDQQSDNLDCSTWLRVARLQESQDRHTAALQTYQQVFAAMESREFAHKSDNLMLIKQCIARCSGTVTVTAPKVLETVPGSTPVSSEAVDIPATDITADQATSASKTA